MNSDTFPLDDASGKTQTTGCNYGAKPTTAQEIANLDAYQPHIAEGVNQAAKNELTCTSAGTTDVIEPQTAIVHAVAATPVEAKAIHDERAWVVWSPRSNVALYGNTAPVTLLDTMGVGLVLGTDWLLSGSMNLARELALRRRSEPEAIRQALLGLRAVAHGDDQRRLRHQHRRGIGMLKKGFVADIAILDGRHPQGPPHGDERPSPRTWRWCCAAAHRSTVTTRS